jgi:formate C-acetyltransferase
MILELEERKERVLAGKHKALRQGRGVDVAEECKREGLSWMRSWARLTRRMCEQELVVIESSDRIVFARTLVHSFCPVPENIPRDTIGSGVDNVCADWGMALAFGLKGRRDVAVESKAKYSDDAESVEFLDSAIEVLDAMIALAARYRDAAVELGRDDLVEILSQVPAGKPRTFHEALQSLRFMQAGVWMNGNGHVGFGRFDQYMWPYLEADLDSGRTDMDEAAALLAEFFISLNMDSDIHPGVQQGDNGQSLMLGGVKPDGSSAVNPLTWLVLKVSEEVNMIDPKINLRVSKDTPLDLLVEASRLTKRGLGFPQYSNDDVVIPALISHGYSVEDARNYTVAACWEFIIPGKGMDVPNINALSFPAAVDMAIKTGLKNGSSFDEILDMAGSNILDQVNMYVDNKKTKTSRAPAPYYSCVMTNCLEKGKDMNHGGAEYYNYGIHGSGSSNAADALAAVKHLVFDTKQVSPDRFLAALQTDYADEPTLRETLLQECPKVGNNDDRVDALLVKLFEYFADACESIKDNGRGGIVRPGTGSAMYYIWLTSARNVDILEPAVGATADGRHATDFLSCSLAPASGVPVNGPLSVLQSFSKIDYQRICNGGPITMELSDTVFRSEDALTKVAMLVQAFANLGCHQMQLNTLNPETLLDAREHPEKHRNLIVRVWGWSGYFCELTPEYQEHIISRHVYTA